MENIDENHWNITMPVHNKDVAVIFEEMADLLEIENANPFRVRAYRNAARTIRGMAKDLGDMIREGKDLTELTGIGKDLAAKIREIEETGRSIALDKLHKEVPASLEDLMHLPGLGPRRVKTLYEELGITTLTELEQKARAGLLRRLPGFGVKTEQQILENIITHRTKKQRFLRSTAAEYAEPLLKYLHKVPGVEQAVIAGSFRRGLESVGDVDILVSTVKAADVMDRFVHYDEVQEILSKGRTRASVILRCGLQVDLRLVSSGEFGAALHYFTGSKIHNIQIRRIGQQKGLKINEYGVFKGQRRVAGKTEDSVFQAVGLDFIPPELRQGRSEIQAARAGHLPRRLDLKDLKGDLHVHTTASDGQAGLEEMVLAARGRGLNYIAITDHSRHLTVAHGLDAERLLRQMDEIDRLNESIKGMTVLKGIEVDILEDGRLDLPDKVLGKLDVVVGAVHSHFRLSREKQTDRLLRAMDNRYFSILAHPSGRLLQERQPYNVDMECVIRMARERGCFMELNSQPQRLDLTDTYCQMARSEGVLISINSDAHAVDDFDILQYGIIQARRGWLEKTDILNSRPLTQVKKLLRQTMQ